jgi:hypothetical protein
MIGKPKTLNTPLKTLTRQASANKSMGEMLQRQPFVDASKRPVDVRNKPVERGRKPSNKGKKLVKK